MKVHYNNSFVNKLYTNQYMLGGFYLIASNYQNDKLFTNFYDNNSLFVGGISNVFNVDTYLEDDGFVIQVNLSKLDNVSQNVFKYQLAFLYYIDYFTHPDLTKDKLDRSSAAIGDLDKVTKLRLDSVALCLDFENNIRFMFSVNEIIKIPYPNGVPSCSFYRLTDRIEVSHYNSNYIGDLNYFNDNTGDNVLISKSSGLERLRDHVTDIRTDKLNGTMCIKSNGVIQL